MNEKEFLALPPDERDAIIAERALSWATHRTKSGRLWAKYGGHSWGKCPHFTTTWTNDFWCVVTRLRDERGIYVDIHTYADFFEAVVRNNGGEELARDAHPQVQLAVAVAVLKAFGIIAEVVA
jgi:hypothetical protein